MSRKHNNQLFSFQARGGQQVWVSSYGSLRNSWPPGLQSGNNVGPSGLTYHVDGSSYELLLASCPAGLAVASGC